VLEKAALACGVRRSRLASALSTLSTLSHNVLGRPRPALHRLCGPTLPAPQRSSYLCDWAVTVQLAPTQPQPADRLTPFGSLLKPQPTSPHPRHLREELGPQLCSRHCAVSSWLQTLIRYSCLNVNVRGRHLPCGQTKNAITRPIPDPFFSRLHLFAATNLLYKTQQASGAPDAQGTRQKKARGAFFVASRAASWEGICGSMGPNCVRAAVSLRLLMPS